MKPTDVKEHAGIVGNNKYGNQELNWHIQVDILASSLYYQKVFFSAGIAGSLVGRVTE